MTLGPDGHVAIRTNPRLLSTVPDASDGMIGRVFSALCEEICDFILSGGDDAFHAMISSIFVLSRPDG